MKVLDSNNSKVTARQAFPPWIRVRVGGAGVSSFVEAILERTGVRTVCRSAICPNVAECFGRGTATFMILGGVCTRNCGFCAVAGGVPCPPEADEPQRVAEAAAAMRLRHVVLTSVTRDDLPDGGAGHFASAVEALRALLPAATTEVLVPDFQGRRRDVEKVTDAAPDVFNHNLETVRRLQATVRPQADYQRSLKVLRMAASRPSGLWVKSGLMVGLGETDAEVHEAMVDLRSAGCVLLTIGQYLSPSREHLAVHRFVHPEKFEEYARWGQELGFRETAAGPLVRSSFQAGALFRRARRGSAAGK